MPMAFTMKMSVSSRTQKGVSAQVVETISRIKQEPDWMRELRLKGV